MAQVKILSDRLKQHYPHLQDLLHYGSDKAAGLDLRANLSAPLILKAGQTTMVGTGLAIYLQDSNLAAQILPRSGLGTKHGIVLGNLVGLIDADYQGELMICLWNRSTTDYTLQPFERIAQYVVIPIVRPNFAIVDEFNETSARGADGFGSTGQV